MRRRVARAARRLSASCASENHPDRNVGFSCWRSAQAQNCLRWRSFWDQDRRSEGVERDQATSATAFRRLVSEEVGAQAFSPAKSPSSAALRWPRQTSAFLSVRAVPQTNSVRRCVGNGDLGALAFVSARTRGVPEPVANHIAPNWRMDSPSEREEVLAERMVLALSRRVD